MRLYGKNSVFERIKTNPSSIKRIFLNKEKPLAAGEKVFLEKIKTKISYLFGREFLRLEKGIRSQGIIAEVQEFQYADFQEVISMPPKTQPCLLFLDELNDPQNLGAIIRTAACFGNFVVVLPRHESIEVTEAVLRVASGGENYAPVARVTNLSQAIDQAKDKGYWIAGSVVEGGKAPWEARLNFPLAIVIGSEGKGIRKGLLPHFDYKLTLPMPKAGLSFNAAVAASIFCYEAMRQKIR